jgi:hypothetical protein
MLRSTGHDYVPMHDGAGGKKMLGGKKQQGPSPFATTDPRDEERSMRCVACVAWRVEFTPRYRSGVGYCYCVGGRGGGGGDTRRRRQTSAYAPHVKMRG